MTKHTFRSTKRRFFRKFGIRYRPSPIIYPKTLRLFPIFKMTVKVLPLENAPFGMDENGQRIRMSDAEKTATWGVLPVSAGKVFFVDRS